MNNNVQVIDVDNWKGKDMYDLFIDNANPFIRIATVLDVSHLYKLSKKGHSFTALMNFCVVKVMNRMDAFKYRIVGDKVCFYNNLRDSFVVKTDESKINFALLKYHENFADFEKEYVIARDYCLQNKADYEPCEDDYGVVWASNSPWASYTYVGMDWASNKDSIPKFTWDKFNKHLFKRTVNFCMQVNHCFIDGYIMSKFINKLQELINAFKI